MKRESLKPNLERKSHSFNINLIFLDSEDTEVGSENEINSSSASSYTDDSTDYTDSEACSDFDYNDDSEPNIASEDLNDFENENNTEEDSPLFEGAPLTVKESILCILALVLKFSLSGVVLAGILELISLHCPEPNFCRTSLFTFKKYFEDLHTPVTRHYYCPTCLSSLEDKMLQCPKCFENIECSYFLSISVIDQIEALYLRRGFYEKLQYRFHRQKLSPENIEDIYDGIIYKDLSKPGCFLSNRRNISLSWYTDGVKGFKTSKFSFWPFYLVINELPYEERFKKENLVLGGMWFGDEKPVPNLFLHPLYDELQRSFNGVDMRLPNNEILVNVKGMIICGSCDLPAKALFLNMKQYNGKFGCHKCKQEGIRLGKRQVYPYERNMDLRNEEETLQHAQSLSYEVKGSCILSSLVYKWITTTSLDAMHMVFLGVLKALMTFWFDSKFAGERFSIFEAVTIVDERIESLLPPNFIQRRLLSIKDHIKLWKASMYKTFFFYHSLPILKDLLPQEYFEHYQLLVGAIYLLCQPSISNEMLDNASRMIHEFVSRFENLYELENMTCNVHSLLHLPLVVKLLGPLFIYQCFTYESINGMLKNLIHGSKCAQLQISYGALCNLHYIKSY